MPLTLPLFPETYSVSGLCAEVQDLLGRAYASVWVAGEVQRAKRTSRGHLYFELVEKGAGDDILGKIEAVVWRRDHERVRAELAATGQEILDGQQVRCRGNLDFYPAGGRLQVCVREVDPVFGLGLLARRRQETLAALAAAGLLELNKALRLPEVPLRIALVTSGDGAAYHDFLVTLAESGYGFRVLFLHAAVQGPGAEGEVASALAVAAAVDCVVLIRGGGSRSELAVFDSRRIAEAVATCAVPVLTGLGHEIDQSIADLVAHTALKTPTGVAQFLIERIGRVERRVEELERALRREAFEPLRRGREAVGRAERGLEQARWRLQGLGNRLAAAASRLVRAAGQRLRGEERRLGERSGRLRRAAPAVLARRRREPGLAGRRLAGAAESRLREATALLDGRERLARQLSPERTLERGFSVTRDGAGRIVRDPAQVAAGELLVTQVTRGSLRSRVEGER